MTEREVLQLALESLEVNLGTWSAKKKAIPAIKEVLAQPEQEPVALSNAVFTVLEGFTLPQDVRKILETAYFKTTPPQRTWVGLTAAELNMITNSMRTWNSHSLTDVYIAIEAKLKEKNT